MGFIGLAECLKALIGEHHGESEDAQQLGLEIIGHMRQRMDEAIREVSGLNFSLIATPAEGLSGTVRDASTRRSSASCRESPTGSTIRTHSISRCIITSAHLTRSAWRRRIMR